MKSPYVVFFVCLVMSMHVSSLAQEPVHKPTGIKSMNLEEISDQHLGKMYFSMLPGSALSGLSARQVHEQSERPDAFSVSRKTEGDTRLVTQSKAGNFISYLPGGVEFSQYLLAGASFGSDLSRYEKSVPSSSALPVNLSEFVTDTAYDFVFNLSVVNADDVAGCSSENCQIALNQVAFLEPELTLLESQNSRIALTGQTNGVPSSLSSITKLGAGYDSGSVPGISTGDSHVVYISLKAVSGSGKIVGFEAITRLAGTIDPARENVNILVRGSTSR